MNRPRVITDEYGTSRRYKWCQGCLSWLLMDPEHFSPRRLYRKDGTYGMGFDSRCKACDTKRCRGNQQRWRRDPVKGEVYREARRMAYRLRQAKKGRPVPALTEEEYRARYGTGATRRYRLPKDVVQTMAGLIEAEMQKGVGLEDLAAQAGLPARRLWAVRHDLSASLYTADRLCIALGVHLTEVGA